MSIYDNLPGKVSLSGKVRTIEEDLYGIDIDDPSKIRPYELLVPLQDAVQNFVPGVYIPVSEKGQANGVPTLDATGKVPAAQLPANPGNFLPLSGGAMEGNIDMDGYSILGADEVYTNGIIVNNLGSNGNDITVFQQLNMYNNKIVDVAKGSSTKDVATIDNINDHDTSPFAHADIRNLIAAIQGTYVYVGKINLPTESVTDTTLNNTVFAILARTPLNGDVLVDNDNGEWRFDGTNWVNLGHFDIAMASAFNDGLMSKEDYTKLSALLSRGDFDSLIATLATMDYLVNNYYNKTQSDVQVNAIAGDIALRELLSNKATNFSVVDDIKYPTTKAISTELAKKIDKRYITNLVTNGNFVNTSNWLTYRGLFSVSNNIGSFVGNVSSCGAFIYQSLSVNINDVIYVKVDLRTTDTSVTTIRLLWQSATALINISNPIQNQWYSGSASIISTSSTPRYELGIRATETNGKTLQTKNALAFNLTALYGVTATSGTAYDNAVAEIEAELLANGGYIDGTKELNIYNVASTKANITQEAWITPTLINGWVNRGTPYETLQYMKDSFGFVHIKGSINSGVSGVIGGPLLPVGYRPSGVLEVIIVKELSFAIVSISTGGTVSIANFTPGLENYTLNVTFRAEV